MAVMVRGPSLEFGFMIVYDSDRTRERESFGDDLVQFTKDSPTLVDAPWFLVGDFNCIHRVNECQGRRIPITHIMETFNDYIFRVALIEAPVMFTSIEWIYA